MTNNKVSDSFYVRMGIVLILLIFAGFIPFITSKQGAGDTMSPLLMVHGILLLGWFTLYLYQASLIPKKNIKRHMALGKSSLILSAAIIITSFMVTQHSFDTGSSSATPFTPEHFILLPIIDIIGFIIFYSLAFANRKQASAHKHYMLLTGIVIMDPATARLALTIGFMPIGLLIHFGLIGAMIFYDRKTDNGVHIATKLGLGFLILLYTLIFFVGPTEGWAKFAHMLLG